MSEGDREQTFIYNGRYPDRLDKVICAFLSEKRPDQKWSRSQIKQWIEAGLVSVDGKTEEKAGAVTKPGAAIAFSVPPSTTELTPYEFPLDIVFEDDELIVINKPAGISMHPGAGNYEKTLANALAAHFTTEMKGIRPGIVHRLDKDTTGLVAAVKTVAAHAALARQFASREAGRRYIALVLSTPRAKRAIDTAESGTIEGNIGRHPVRRQEFAVVGPENGKGAVTHWKALERMPHASLLEVKIATGRTHQIRVHMAHMNCPVIGDPVYGDFSPLPASLKQAAASFGRQALHAAYLEFAHPRTGERMSFEQGMPEDMEALVERFRRAEGHI